MENNTLEAYLKPVRDHLDEGEIAEAIDALQLLDQKFALKIGDDLTQQSSRFKINERDQKRGMISTDEYRRYAAQINFALLDLIKEIPKKAERNTAISQLSNLATNDPTGGFRLEKIMGGQSNLLKINWLEKALKAAKAVCRIVREDGEVGTGWLISGGYLMTNNHVLPSVAKAGIARAEFNFEIDSSGNSRNLVTYDFNTSDFLTNVDLDFTRVKVKDRADQPLAQWGFLEIDPESVPVKGEAVTIIQHPKGEDKQIALNANEVLGQSGFYLFYSTDTEPGSSGSPVFNKNWKVVAIHHAGGKYPIGGVTTEANRGIVFKQISPLLKTGATGGGTASGGGAKSKNESFHVENVPQPPVVIAPEKPAQPIVNQLVTGIPKLVVLYAIEDKDHALQLEKQLKLLIRANKITAHFQHKIAEGDVVGAAKTAIAEARLVAVLATNEFFFDDNNYELVENAKSLGKSIVPILVKSFNLAETGLGGLRALPSNNKFIDTGWPSADSAWLDISNGLRAVLVPNG